MPLCAWPPLRRAGLGFALALGSVTSLAAADPLSVDFSSHVGQLASFWNASGMNHNGPEQGSGHKYLNDVIAQDMQLIGSIPHQGNLYQRPHYLLSLLSITARNGDTLSYDWSKVDTVLDEIVGSGQKLYFELMGYPAGSNITSEVSDFGNDANVKLWRIIVRDLAAHLEGRYGKAEVESWYFEVWNEPDAWPQNDLFAYYDACWAGLSDTDPALRFGGPGTAGAFSANVAALVDHCLTGKNYFTGATGTPMSLVSFHNKAFADPQTSTDIAVISGLLAGRPALADKLFVNSEADTEVGWQQELDFRATPWYSSYIARQIMDAQALVIQGLSVKFRLSNDSAFVGDWKNRTHFAWFGDDTTFALIKKPSHNVFTLLSFLGGEQCQTSADVKKGVSTAVTAIASARDTSQAAVGISNYSGDTNATGTTSLAVTLKNVPFSAGKLVEYRIDKDHSNGYAIWQGLGSPSTLSAEQLQTLRDKQELERLSLADFSSAGASINLDLPVNGVSLLLLSADPGKPPSQPSGIARRIYASLVAGREDVAVTWRHGDFTVKTFEVYFSATANGTYARVNTPDIVCTAFTHQVAKGSAGFYKVRAVDYWDRAGAFSDTIGLDGTVIPSPDDPSDAGAGGSTTNGGAAGAPGASGASSGSGGVNGAGGAVGAAGGSGSTSPATGGAPSDTSASTDGSSSSGGNSGCACTVPIGATSASRAGVWVLAALLIWRRKKPPACSQG